MNVLKGSRSLEKGQGQACSREAYLDNAATTRPRPSVIAAMADELASDYGNPSSTHAAGRRARVALEQARATLADVLGVDAREIYFTSGGTESNNLAICGAARAAGREAGQIVVSDLEHPSVTRSVRGMKREGWDVSYVNAVGGNYDLDQLAGFLRRPTQLITTMTVQNELGYCFPIPEIASLRDELAPGALVHTDAVQAFGKLPVRPREWGVDLVSLSGHKIGGPKGIGALYVREGAKLFTTAFGGGQERGLRSGTQSVFLAVGLAEAARQACADLAGEERRVRMLWRRLDARLADEVPAVKRNSREDGSPYLYSFSVRGMRNQQALDFLSDRGVYVSKASACENNEFTVEPGTWRPKHPLSLQAAGIPLSEGKNTLRVSFGYDSVVGDVDRLVEGLKAFIGV